MSSPMDNINQRSMDIMDIIKQQQQMDKVQALLKLMEISDIKINIVGREQKVLNLELITEYPNTNWTKMMMKHETWRHNLAEVMHYSDINEEKIVGAMNVQVML